MCPTLEWQNTIAEMNTKLVTGRAGLMRARVRYGVRRSTYNRVALGSACTSIRDLLRARGYELKGAR